MLPINTPVCNMYQWCLTTICYWYKSSNCTVILSFIILLLFLVPLNRGCSLLLEQYLFQCFITISKTNRLAKALHLSTILTWALKRCFVWNWLNSVVLFHSLPLLKYAKFSCCSAIDGFFHMLHDINLCVHLRLHTFWYLLTLQNLSSVWLSMT